MVRLLWTTVGGSLESFHVIQDLILGTYLLKELKTGLTEAAAHPCSEKHYSQLEAEAI